jgi:hypothetical protein
LLSHPAYASAFQSTELYFEKLRKVMFEEKGLETFANFLYNLPLQAFDYNKLMVTRLLTLQKKENLNLLQKWWLSRLVGKRNSDVDKRSDCPFEPTLRNWHPTVVLESLYNSFDQWLRQQDQKKQKGKLENEYDSHMQFWNDLSTLVPKSCFFQETNEHGTMMKLIHFCPFQECVNHICRNIAGMEYFFESEWNGATLHRVKEQRLSQLSVGDLFGTEFLTFIPNDFYGMNLRAVMLRKEFQIIKSADWRPVDKENKGRNVNATVNMEDRLQKQIKLANEEKEKQEEELLQKMELKRQKKRREAAERDRQLQAQWAQETSSQRAAKKAQEDAEMEASIRAIEEATETEWRFFHQRACN